MQLLIFMLGAAALCFWLLWWMTFRALRRAQRTIAQHQARIDTQFELIDQLLDRQYGLAGEMPELTLRQRARREVRSLLTHVHRH